MGVGSVIPTLLTPVDTLRRGATRDRGRSRLVLTTPLLTPMPLLRRAVDGTVAPPI